MESDEEESVGPSCRKLASTMQKKTSPKSSFRGGTSLPLPPTGLLIAKRSKNLSSTATQGSCSNAAELSSSNLMDISSNTIGRLHTEASSSTVDFSTQEVFQPVNYWETLFFTWVQKHQGLICIHLLRKRFSQVGMKIPMEYNKWKLPIQFHITIPGIITGECSHNIGNTILNL
ncbi:Uncharacterized protein APZ42_028006 [Daphnia magna]|uniref:Uncharacterized protein n=1 Tax=Daphnia magna TaxID=35525 RepID=A0A164QWL4_9CRUS|nr:Uncharacterized protein APZ42_028006 [Daphnia magna]